MGQGYGSIAAGLLAGTDSLDKAPGYFWNANRRVFRQVFDLSLATVAKVSGDNNLCFKKPRGCVVDKIKVTSSVSLTTSQLSFGIAGATAKYGALKAYGTTPKAEVVWAEPTAMDDVPVDTEETITMTHGTADLPGAGIIIVDMEVLTEG